MGGREYLYLDTQFKIGTIRGKFLFLRSVRTIATNIPREISREQCYSNNERFKSRNVSL